MPSARRPPIPSLWRQGQLAAKHGLFELTDGVYQVRGFDLSNMSFIEGDTGVIIIDTLMSNETAAAALALYREHRGEPPGRCRDHHPQPRRPLRRRRPASPTPTRPIYAPAGFLEHAVVENVYAGAAMSRARPTSMRRTCRRAHRPDRLRTRAGHLVRHDVADGADRRCHAHRSGGDDRRRRGRLPGDARHRGAGGDELLLPDSSARCAWPRTPPTPCTSCSPCAARRCATAAPGHATSARRCGCSARTPTSCSPRTTGRSGAPSGSPRS